jgi:hypothetical protein
MGMNFSSLREDYLEPKNVDDQTLYHRKLEKAKEEMDAWERVAAIFETDIYGDISPDLARIKDSTMMATVLGAVIGGLNKSREAGERFMRQNAHEKFETPQYAQKAMQDKVMLGFGSGAFRASWRLALFTFIYTAGTSMIAAYRGRHGILEHVGGAAAAGFLYKFKQGPKPAIAGLVVGAGLGLTAGGFTYYGAKMLGKSPEELIQWHYNNIEARKRAEVDAIKAARHKDTEDDLLKFHETFMATDELSMSRVKGTDIGTITEGVKKHKFELSEGDFEALMPRAVAEAVREVKGAESAKTKSNSNSNINMTPSPTKTESKNEGSNQTGNKT